MDGAGLAGLADLIDPASPARPASSAGTRSAGLPLPRAQRHAVRGFPTGVPALPPPRAQRHVRKGCHSRESHPRPGNPPRSRAGSFGGARVFGGRRSTLRSHMLRNRALGVRRTPHLRALSSAVASGRSRVRRTPTRAVSAGGCHSDESRPQSGNPPRSRAGSFGRVFARAKDAARIFGCPCSGTGCSRVRRTPTRAVSAECRDLSGTANDGDFHMSGNAGVMNDVAPFREGLHGQGADDPSGAARENSAA